MARRKLTDYCEHIKLYSHRISRKKYDQTVKGRLHKKNIDSNYHTKRKQNPEYLKNRRDYMTKYNNTPERKIEHSKVQAKHRSKPKVKKQNAIYNSQWAKDNPDKVLINIKRGLKKFDGVLGLSWTTFHSQLKGWARIIQQDCDEICQVCGDKSTQAHHIIHKTLYPHLSFNRSNGIALCDKCHYEVHGKMLV